jgi:RimJ/RimL family protein N-acetyltransferase
MPQPIVPPEPPLADGEVTLRLWRGSDVPALTAACQDPELSRWLPAIPYPYGESDARAYIAGLGQRLAEGSGANFAIVDGDGELLGGVGFRVDTPWRAEIGYWVRRDLRRRGIATRAVRLLSRWLLRERSFGRVQLHADVENAASHGVAERAGFVREGVLRSHLHHRGEARDHLVYSLVAADL